MRILVVEDQRDLNRLMVKTLQKEGYAVDGCSTWRGRSTTG